MRKKIYIILVILFVILLALYNFNENASCREGVTSSKKRDTGGTTVGIIMGSVGVTILILYLTLFLYKE
jgi:hypothetical protein